MKILVTGSRGLVGSALCRVLRADGHDVVGLDLRGDHPGDVRSLDTVRERVEGCVGIVHLAAVSRVAWAEDDPSLCWATNVDGTRNVLRAARGSRPWVLFASSREVYGQPRTSPTPESAPLQPLNVYGRAKVAGETLVVSARAGGRATAVVRLSNIYGAVDDHSDRVVPAFARAAVEGSELRVEGRRNAFDFVHLDDAVDGRLRAQFDIRLPLEKSSDDAGGTAP